MIYKEYPTAFYTSFFYTPREHDLQRISFVPLENMIYKGLNEEDATFLGFVAKKQAEIDQKRFDDESEELQEYRVGTCLTRLSLALTPSLITKDELNDRTNSL